MSQIKIPLLIVDDKKFMRDVIKTYIENKEDWSVSGNSFSFEITTAKNGEEAVLYYANGRHEIIIMDLEMDEVDGLTATKEILEMNPNAKIIGIASEGDARVEEFKNSGIKFFLEKPFQDTYINSRIEMLMDEILKEKPLASLDISARKKSIFKKILFK